MTQSEIKPDAELDEPLRFERLLAEISPFFINLPADRIDSEIEAAQRRVCELLDLDRSSLFQASERDPETLMLTHFYQPPGSRIPPERMSLKEFFPWALQKVLGGETVTISKMTDLPAEAGQDRETFGLYGTRSVVVVPLSIGGGPPFGVLTFAVIREERGWPETVVKSFPAQSAQIGVAVSDLYPQFALAGFIGPSFATATGQVFADLFDAKNVAYSFGGDAVERP